MFKRIRSLFTLDSELNLSNDVTNWQSNFGQPILMEGIPTRFRLTT